ncbi:MAG: DUF4458 domain-containing protein [Bacteroidales bacterium]|nr:DUF4458 domain-containing protein [Bacteroidales bacterium]
MKLYRYIVLLAITLGSALFAGCSLMEEPQAVGDGYGHVQFKLYKEASYSPTKAVTSQIDYLSDVSKIRVVMRSGGKDIAQTLVMNYSNKEAAEFGLRSDKIKLLAGTYELAMFTLFDSMDHPLYESTPTGDFAQFEVVAGGLCVHELTANTVERGKVKFNLVKDLSDFNETPATKAVSDKSYTFDQIGYVSVSVRKDNTTTTFEMLPAEFNTHFTDDGVEDGYLTSSLQCDTLLTLTAGSYKVVSYVVYNEDKDMLETALGLDAEFVVKDNDVTEADVPVKLHESDEYIKDYYALYEIWKSLHGEDWYYIGENFPRGANWDFNKDPDLWGDQPGVQLHSNGRVALVNLSDFGFYGELSPAIGQLTEMVELYLGNHNDINLIGYDPLSVSGKNRGNRMDVHKEFMYHLNPPTQMSEPIARALMENDKDIPEIRLYKTMNEDQIIEKGTGKMRIQPKDMVSGKLNNGLTKLPDEIGNLTKLEQLFIANGTLEKIPATVANLTSCTDVEIYNCPKMTEFPVEIAQMPNLITLNIANNRQWNADEALKGLKALATGPSREKLQILYFNENNLELIPAEITNMKKLGLMNFASNKIKKIETAWGTDIKPVQLYLDFNQLSEFPVNEDGVFCYVEDAETFSVKGNNFTVFPDIFDAESLYAVVSIDFSFNHISRFPDNFKGVFVETLTLANNPELEVYPIQLKESDSKIMYINFRGCNLKTFPEKCFTYPNAVYLQSFDFSYNDLTDLPSDMHSGNMPYMYGVELSYNQFSIFPWEPLDSQYLTVFAIRGQRDKNGARCLSEWPTGLYNHRGLRGFYIGSNNLGKIEDTISTLIYYLDISDNPEIIFDASDICYAYQVGAYYLIYDKTQDIRNCDYMLN